MDWHQEGAIWQAWIGKGRWVIGSWGLTFLLSYWPTTKIFIEEKDWA